jgi:uncharacterized protein CbrC (UPF0167 family)
MKKVIRLTENDLSRIVRRVIKETSGPGFSAWLEQQMGVHTKGAYCVVIQDCLDNNGYENYDDAPEEFKKLVQTYDCFYNASYRGLLKDKVKEVMRTRTISDTKTKTLLNYLLNNNF